MMREKGERVFVLREERKREGRLLMQTESVYSLQIYFIPIECLQIRSE